MVGLVCLDIFCFFGSGFDALLPCQIKPRERKERGPSNSQVVAPWFHRLYVRLHTNCHIHQMSFLTRDLHLRILPPKPMAGYADLDNPVFYKEIPSNMQSDKSAETARVVASSRIIRLVEKKDDINGVTSGFEW